MVMELKTFAEDDFDPKKWINKAWGSSGNQDKGVFVANTVSRLQLYMKQLTNSLDETTTQIVTSVPRILHDAAGLQTEGALLQHQLLTLERKVVGVEEQTGHSIQSLQRIDQLKSRLENAASALREADKWAALASSLEDTLDAGVPTQRDKLAELAGQVAAMTGSLEVLVDAPDYDEKRLQMETLYNRLEAAVSAPLIDALTQMNADRARTYVSLWAAMRRTDSLLASWRRAAAAAAAAAWARMDAHSLPALRQSVAAQANTQVEWLTDVLKSESPLLELVRLYTDLLMSLDPTPTKVLTANIKLCSTPQEGIEFLIDVRTELDQFVATFTTLLEAPRQNRESVPPPALRELGRAVWAPLRTLLPQYTELQTQVFNSHLMKERRDQEDLLECSRSLQSVVERSERWLRAGLASALKIAGRAALAYYVPTVENLASTLSTDISAQTRRIEASFHASPSPLGVLSASFPAALALGTAVGSLLDILAAVMAAVGDEDRAPASPPSPLHAVEDYLSPAPSPPPSAAGAGLRRAGGALQSLAVNILREPVMRQLDTIPSLPVWSDNDALSTDLPDYALSPQEYITEIGQYLMTLPQHLEMHLSEKQAPWQFLTEVCNNTCEAYAEKIMTVKDMDALGTKRCLTDIVYLSSVVEDLGSSITPSLKNLERSLRAAAPAPAQA